MKIKRFKHNMNFPTRSHKTDGGLDIYLPEDIVISPMETLTIPLGIGVEIPEGYTSMLVPRSSMAKKGLIMQTSLIDRGYTGEIHLIITNASITQHKFKVNDRLCSLVIFKALFPELEEVVELPKTDRGSKGLGSTGK